MYSHVHVRARSAEVWSINSHKLHAWRLEEACQNEGGVSEPDQNLSGIWESVPQESRPPLEQMDSSGDCIKSVVEHFWVWWKSSNRCGLPVLFRRNETRTLDL